MQLRRAARTTLGWLLSASAIAAFIVAPQAMRTGQDTEPTFRSSVEIVPLAVTVQRTDGSYVSGLDVSKFRVLDEGTPRPIDVFYADAAPTDLAIVLDTSLSMTGRLEMSRRAAAVLTGALEPGDRATLMTFGMQTRVAVPLTSDLALVDAATAGLKASGATALYDALYVALREFRPSATEARRRAMVVISDGDDTDSLITFDRVVEAARVAGVVLYTIRTMPGNQERQLSSTAAYELRTLARESGGRAFTAATTKEIARASEAIASEFAHQYLLGFAPSPDRGAAGYRRVSVSVDVADPRVSVRSRVGYVAMTAGS